MGFMKVASIENLPVGEMKQFYIQEREILIINANDRLYGLDGRCTHAGAPLAEGEVKGEVLTCPWHGSQFRITDGSVLHGPAEKPLRSYPVSLRDNTIFIEL